MKKTILAIETSCDDTGLALVSAEGGFSKPKFKVIKNLVSSQIKVHRPFGGVVPNLAKREHIKNLPLLYKKLLHSKFYILNSIDMIAVTIGPGLEPALWAGINFAQTLIDADINADKRGYKKIGVIPHENRRKSANQPELIGVNHLEGHLYSYLLSAQKKKISFPAVALLVSGGHTAILFMKNIREWKILGETRDDAAGEAFDKVARMLELPYPGGPEIEKLAKKGNNIAIEFPKPMLNQKNYDFSFSGLKTSVFYYLRDRGYSHSGIATRVSKKNLNPIPQTLMANIAASFQKAVIDVLTIKTMRAAKEHKARSLILCGGVAANKTLRKELKRAAGKLGMDFFVPDMKYNNDNGAMIAAAAYMGLSRKKKYKLEAKGDLNI